MTARRIIRPNTYLATVWFLATVIPPLFFGNGLLQEALPDASSGIQTQRFVLEREVYSARDSVVHLVDPVGRQKHDTWVIL